MAARSDDFRAAEQAAPEYSVWLAGLYCGSYPVIKPSGTIQIPYGSDPDGLADSLNGC